MRQPISFAYDAPADILTIERIRYSCDLFRYLGQFSIDPKLTFRVASTPTGIITVECTGGSINTHSFDLLQ